MEKDSKRESVASRELSMPDWAHQSHQLDQLTASTPETSCLVGQVLLLLGATAEVVMEYRSAPTPDPARLNIRAMGAAHRFGPTSELHPRCPCRSERQGVPQVPIQLAKKQSPCTTMRNQKIHKKTRARASTLLYHDQDASVYSSFSSKIGFSLLLELHGWVGGRYGSASSIDSGGSTPRDARTGWC